MSTKQHYREMVKFVDRPMDSMVGDVGDGSAGYLPTQDPLGSVGGDDVERGLEDVRDLVRTVVRAADARKAEQIVALQVHRITTLTSYLVILSGSSRPQNSAIAASITSDVFEQFGMRPVGNGVPEGSAESGWAVVDYGSVMVHIMTPKSRLFYNVEEQWRKRGAVEMDISDCVIPNTMLPPAPASDDVPKLQQQRVEPAQEDDPFWS
jgi:ribosome-associated protein